jgi:hypothetical protein
MFAWFQPTCPCDPAAKAWVEQRLQWLAGQFPSNAFRDRPVVLPTLEFFPDHYDCSEECARGLLNRVCLYMGIDPLRISLEFIEEKPKTYLVNEDGRYLPFAAGTCQKGQASFLIHLAEEELDEPMQLVATIAHELAHVRLLGEGRIAPDVYDNELLTDLTSLFLGMGVFAANSPRNWDSQYSKWPDTNLLKPSYMTPPMFGYALAHLAWHRREARPAWTKCLHWSARANLKQGLRYLDKTADSAFCPG